jgi:Lrp/AsnC family leucine-responsive transcriptional regulator
MDTVQLDDIDRSVIEELQRDSRATYAQIGAHVGLSAAAVHARVKNLERRGVVTGFGARIDAEAVGLPVTAFLAVRVANGVIGDGVKDQLRTIPEIEECHSVAGAVDLLLKVRCGSPTHLETLIRRVNTVPGVDRTDTTVVLTTVFDDRPLPLARRGS